MATVDRPAQTTLSDVERTLAIAPSAGGIPLAWVIDELQLAWQCAQREAADAYTAWSDSRADDAYVAYRAAQDRADAAQEVLAARSRERP